MLRIYRDSGHGITEHSLKFWNENKGKIGEIVRVEVGFEPLREMQDSEGIPLEWNFGAFGKKGAIFLSGCNCGYGGTGPNGTAKILAELGLPLEKARQAMWRKTINFDAIACKIK